MRKKSVWFFMLLVVMTAGMALGLVSCLDMGGMIGKSKPPTTTVHPPGPYTKGTPRYWIDVSTTNFQVPGMSEDAGIWGKVMGKVAGAVGMPVGTHYELFTRLNSHPLPSNPEANHDIPPGLLLGPTLPLVMPTAAAIAESKGDGERPEVLSKTEPPKMRLKFYWGCREDVGPGQPRIVDTSRMNKTDFANTMVGRKPAPQSPPAPRAGWAYAVWPNDRYDKEVKKGASLSGQHFVHGNYIPHIQFSMDPSHDFLAPVEFNPVTDGLDQAVRLSWREIPYAVGYFILVMAHNRDTGEMIIWNSSQVFDPGWGLINFMETQEVKRLIRSKVVMPPTTTSCVIPKGILAGAESAMVQFIAWGEDYYAFDPPLPAKPTKDWKPDWAVKARFKSVGTLMIGMKQEAEKGEKGESTLDKIKKALPF